MLRRTLKNTNMNMSNKTKQLTETATTEIQSLSHDGRGIATIQAKKAFISGALPGEVVEYRIIKNRRQYIEAELINVITSAANRTTPPCKHYGICGGCSLQHMSMEQQIALKQQTLAEQLKYFGKVEPKTWLSPLTSANLGYRHKARLGVKYVIKKNKVLVGFREKSSRYLADLEQCEILHPIVGHHLTELSQLVASLAEYQHIPQIEIAIGDDEAAMVFRHLTTLPQDDKNKLIEFAKNHRFHIYLQPNPPLPITKIWPDDNHQRLQYTLPAQQLAFLFHPLDFTQINPEMNRAMIEQALSLLELSSNDHVLDLFCGIGNFSLPMAKHAKHVTGIEGSEEMVTRAMANATHNKLTNTAFFVANLASLQEQNSWATQHYDKILLDPPRAGAIEILPLLAKLKAKRLVYVSCNPATLARDAGELVHKYKYSLQNVGIMNMFPHTAHVEAMAMFELEE